MSNNKAPKRITLNQVIANQRKNHDFEQAFQKELLINEIATITYTLRNEAKLTQQELADRSGTTQPVIARLEGGNDSRVPSLELLSRIAGATGNMLSLAFSKS